MNKTDNIDQLVKNWLADLSTSENTICQYKQTIQYWFRYLSINNINVETPVRSNVIAYRNYLQRDGKSPFTVSNYLASVRSFYNWLESNKLGENIAVGIKSHIRYKQHRRDHLSDDQVQKLLTFEHSTIEGLRDYLIIAFMLVFGLRRAEVWGIDDNDIRYKPESGEWVLYVKRKGHIEKEPISNIPPNILEGIKFYQEARGHNECSQLFQDHHHRKVLGLSIKTITNIVNKRLKDAGLKSKTVTAHSLRHTAAVRAIKNGASLYEVQKMMGHTSPETTRPYFMSLEAEKYMNNPIVYEADKSLVKTFKMIKKDTQKTPSGRDAALNMEFSPKLSKNENWLLGSARRAK